MATKCRTTHGRGHQQKSERRKGRTLEDGRWTWNRDVLAGSHPYSVHYSYTTSRVRAGHIMSGKSGGSCYSSLGNGPLAPDPRPLPEAGAGPVPPEMAWKAAATEASSASNGTTTWAPGTLPPPWKSIQPPVTCPLALNLKLDVSHSCNEADTTPVSAPSNSQQLATTPCNFGLTSRASRGRVNMFSRLPELPQTG